MPGYRIFDHTADIGIEWEARSLAGLFEKGAAALADLVAGAQGASGEPASRAIAVDGFDLPDLLVHFLQELRFHFETKRELLGTARIERLEQGSPGKGASLLARVSGRIFEPSRDSVSTQIKAVTYHRLEVAQAPGGEWHARVVFDL